LKPRKLLILRSARVATTAGNARVGYTLGTLCVLAALFAVAAVAGEGQTIRIAFREINHRILIDVRIDGKPATLLFDTGARVSTFGNCGLILTSKEKLTLTCSDEEVTVAFVAPEKGVWLDGFLAADLLSKFAVVKINYKAHVIELEQ